MPAGNSYPSGHLVPSPCGDWLVLQLLRPDSSNLPCLYSAFHLEYPWVLFRFFIIVPSSSITLNRVGPQDVDLAQPSTFSCTTSPASRPATVVTWYIQRTGQSEAEIQNNVTNSTTPPSGDQNTKYTTTSTLTFYTATNDNDARIRCTGSMNIISLQILSQEATLNVRCKYNC